jgi:hypothetical protein
VRRLFVEAGGACLTEPLYGIVYYVAQQYRPTNDADADNLSKRLWDALQATAYDDDKLVRLRIAGVIAPSSLPTAASLDDLDLTGAPDDVAGALAGFIAAGEDHNLYVEIGLLHPAMFRFGLAIKG